MDVPTPTIAQAKAWLNERSNTHTDVSKALATLDRLTPTCTIRALAPPKIQAVFQLRLLGNTWLSDSNINAAFACLQDELDKLGANILLVDPDCLCQLLCQRRTGREPRPGQKIDRFAQHLAGGGDLACLIYRPEKHWVAFATDVTRDNVWYGDPALPAASIVRDDDAELLISFIHRYMPPGRPAPVLQRMPTTPQNFLVDAFNCGPLSLEALRSHLLSRYHQVVPLVQDSLVAGEESRIRWFNLTMQTLSQITLKRPAEEPVSDESDEYAEDQDNSSSESDAETKRPKKGLPKPRNISQRQVKPALVSLETRMADHIRRDLEAARANLDKITTKTQQLRLELKQERQANLDLLKQIDEMSSHQ